MESSTLSKYDLSWGESVCVRQAFVDNQYGNPTFFDNSSLMNMSYPAHRGNADLLVLTRNVIRRQTRMNYRHVFLTNGATGAITITLRAYRDQGYGLCLIKKPPFFTLYPSMICAAYMKQCTVHSRADWEEKHIYLVNSPSNPEGNLGFIKTNDFTDAPVIWDACYANRVYTNGDIGSIDHNVVCGSYSKLTGLNGIRIGWIGTNDDLLADRIGPLIDGEYCGLCSASTKILLNCLDGFDWDSFETNARFRLDLNRSEWQKVTKYFGGQDVPKNGMFYYSGIDDAAKKLMNKASVEYMSGSKMGTTEDFARFNLGQSNDLVSQAVKAIKKSDKI